MRYEIKNGVARPIISIPKVEYFARESLKEWDCPHCGTHYDTTKQENEEYTVGIGPSCIRHIHCPTCKECMGCHSEKVT